MATTGWPAVERLRPRWSTGPTSRIHFVTSSFLLPLRPTIPSSRTWSGIRLPSRSPAQAGIRPTIPSSRTWSGIRLPSPILP